MSDHQSNNIPVTEDKSAGITNQTPVTPPASTDNTSATLETMKKTLLRKCILTSANYGHLANRLQKRKIMFQVLLPYYSVIGIMNGLIYRFFKSLISDLQFDLIGFWGVFISITFLVISMQISLARYPERIKKASDNLNKLKSLHDEINEINDYKEFLGKRKLYNEIILDGGLINKRFFYATCKDQDRRQQADGHIDANKSDDFEVKKHFSGFEIIYYVFTNILESISYVFLFILPIIVYSIIFSI